MSGHSHAMRKLRSLFILGIFIAILPFLGFPTLLKNIFFILTGLFISFVAYLMHLENKKASLKETISSRNIRKVTNIEPEHAINNDVETRKVVEETKIESPISYSYQAPAVVAERKVEVGDVEETYKSPVPIYSSLHEEVTVLPKIKKETKKRPVQKKKKEHVPAVSVPHSHAHNTIHHARKSHVRITPDTSLVNEK